MMFNKPMTDGLPQHVQVLVVDDVPVSQLLAVRILQRAGHAVAAAANGLAALELLARQPFDLIFMDVEMPVMDGFETTGRIRQQEEATGRHIPIVAVTANAMRGDRERCLNAGMDAYVAKPIQADQLLVAIEVVRDTCKKRDSWGNHELRSIATARSGGPQESFKPHTTKMPIGKCFPGPNAFLPEYDGELCSELALLFLADRSARLSKIEQAIASRNGPELRFAAHAMKGSAGVFGDEAAFQAAFRMELVGQNADWKNASEAWQQLKLEIARLAEFSERLAGSGNPRQPNPAPPEGRRIGASRIRLFR